MNPWIGIGTGRCGSLSLSRTCEGLHERWQFPWYDEPKESEMLELCTHLLQGGGAVSHTYLQHIKSIRARVPGLLVVCISRDQERTVNSLLKVANDGSRLRPSDRGKSRYDEHYPIIDAATPRDAWMCYWRMYYELARQIPGVMMFRTEWLNDDDKLGGLMSYLGLDASDLPSRRVYNVSGQALRGDMQEPASRERNTTVGVAGLPRKDRV